MATFSSRYIFFSTSPRNPRLIQGILKVILDGGLDGKEYTRELQAQFYNLYSESDVGVKGVPITFLGKYNPEQFEIIGMDIKDEAEKLGIKPIGEKWCKIYFDQGGTGHFSPNMRNLVVLKDNKARSIYRRVLIRAKYPAKKGD